jgi:hypothetical protein
MQRLRVIVLVLAAVAANVAFVVGVTAVVR